MGHSLQDVIFRDEDDIFFPPSLARSPMKEASHHAPSDETSFSL